MFTNLVLLRPFRISLLTVPIFDDSLSWTGNELDRSNDWVVFIL